MKMIDALYPTSIPAVTTADVVAAYVDHHRNPNSFAQMCARFPHAIQLRITVTGQVAADIIDCEQGTGITPAEAAAWAKKARPPSLPRPVIYCNQLNSWPAVKAAVAALGIPKPDYWVANYSGHDPSVPAGAVAKQWTDLDPNGHNTYDTSSTIAGWPEGADMQVDSLTSGALTQIATAVRGRINAVLYDRPGGEAVSVRTLIYEQVGPLARTLATIKAQITALQTAVTQIADPAAADAKAIVAELAAALAAGEKAS